jgi:hypothetical protein
MTVPHCWISERASLFRVRASRHAAQSIGGSVPSREIMSESLYGHKLGQMEWFLHVIKIMPWWSQGKRMSKCT